MTQTGSRPSGDPETVDPLLVATAAEAVLRAGAIQRSHFGTDVQVDKKGVIDLVTQVDLEVERWFRDMIGERFPDHAVLAEELDDRSGTAARPKYCWVFDPIDGTVNYAHGLPIFCASLALEIEGVPSVAAVYDPMRKELFTAESGAGARLNGAPLGVSGTATTRTSLSASSRRRSFAPERSRTPCGSTGFSGRERRSPMTLRAKGAIRAPTSRPIPP